MKKLLIASLFTLALIVSATGIAPIAHAQLGGGGQDNYCDQTGNCNYTSQTAATAANTTMNATSDAAKAASKSNTDPVGSPGDGYGTIMTWIMKLFAWLLGVAVMTLDYAVFYTVINMGTYVHSLTAIGVTWRILTSIGNIMLVFGFLIIGISTILNTERLGYGKKMLPMLLVAAVFINFSLFFSEAIIDMGNIFAVQFFTQINGGVQPSPQTLANMTVGSEGISNKIMAQVGLANIYNAGQVDPNGELFKAGNSWLIGFMAIILFIIAAFVFFSLAFILIARFVFLIFLIILAPIGFAGLAVPQLKGLADSWWSSLFQQTITAPVLLLLLYVAIAVIADAQFLTGFCSSASSGAGCDWKGSIGGNYQGFIGMLLSFLVAMGLLVFVTIAAKSLSAFGAGAVSKVSGMATHKVTSMAMAPVRFAGRSGKWAARSTVGRGLYKASQAVRTSAGGQTQAGRLLATALGAGGKGFKEAKEKSAKTHDEYIKSVHSAIDDKNAEGVIAAAQARAAATEEPNKIIKASKETVAQSNALAEEVKRLEKLVKYNEDTGQTGSGVMEAKTKLIQARKAVLDNQPVEAKARLSLAEAEKKVAAALKAEEKVTGDVAKQKKEASVAYVENLQTSLKDNPFTYFASGKGGDAAAAKILKETFKYSSDEAKALESLKKVVTPEAPAASAAGGGAAGGGGH